MDYDLDKKLEESCKRHLAMLDGMVFELPGERTAQMNADLAALVAEYHPGSQTYPGAKQATPVISDDPMEPCYAESNFGNFVKAARQQQGWSQTRLGEESDVNGSSISRLEGDPLSRPHIPTIYRLCNSLGVDPRRIVEHYYNDKGLKKIEALIAADIAD